METMEVPKQKNKYDCGIFMLLNAEILMKYNRVCYYFYI